MKAKIATILLFVLVFGWALNHALSYYDPPKKFKWVEYRVPKNMYLSQVAAGLSNQFGKHPGTLTEMIYQENHLNDYYLPEGEIILIPGK
jgi:hypothetical protein